MWLSVHCLLHPILQKQIYFLTGIKHQKEDELTIISHVEVGGLCPGAVPGQGGGADPHAVVAGLEPPELAAVLGGKMLAGHAEMGLLWGQGLCQGHPAAPRAP